MSCGAACRPSCAHKWPLCHLTRARAPGVGGMAVPDWWEVRAGVRGHVPSKVQNPPGEHRVPQPGAGAAPLLQALPLLLHQPPPSTPPQLPQHEG